MSDHEHRYFIFKTFEAFEPYTKLLNTEVPLYHKVEHAILGCNCGSVKKVRIKENEA